MLILIVLLFGSYFLASFKYLIANARLCCDSCNAKLIRASTDSGFKFKIFLYSTFELGTSPSFSYARAIYY